jgi:hypothetical protein
MRDRLPMVFSITALVVAVLGVTPLGEAAWSQVLPRNSVGTLQLKRNAVTSSKLAPNTVRTRQVVNSSLLADDFKSGQLPAGAKGEKGDKGNKGDRGDRGPVGISGYEVVRASNLIPPNTQSSAQAACPSGKKVLGGAASVQGVPTDVSIHTQVTESGTSSFYQAIYTNTSTTTRQLNATAICATVGG